MKRPAIFLAASMAMLVVCAAYPGNGHDDHPDDHHGPRGDYGRGNYGRGPRGNYGGDQYQGGYDTQGRISAIACMENKDGMLMGVAYENEHSGWEHFCMGPKNGYYSSACGNGCIRPIHLMPHENIVKVLACRGGRYGYTSVSFITDANHTITCGKGPFDFTPSNYDQWGAEYQAGLWTVNGASEKVAAKRNLLHAHEAAGADLDGFAKEGYGWGWRSKCQLYESPRQPEWGGAYGDDKEWYRRGYGSEKYGYVQGGSYSKSWNSYNSYYRYTRKDGRSTRYYKDYDTYKHYVDECKPDCPVGCKSSCDYEPGYYYEQVYPLAKFSVWCDRDGAVYKIFKFKWNKQYVPPKPQNVLPAYIQIELESGIPCPTQENEAELITKFQAIATELVRRFEDTIETIKFGELKCVDGPDRNTTLVLRIYFVAAPGKDVMDIVNALANAGITEGTDLCTIIAGGCSDIVVSAKIMFGFREPAQLQTMLMSRSFRTKVFNAITVARSPKFPATSSEAAIEKQVEAMAAAQQASKAQ